MEEMFRNSDSETKTPEVIAPTQPPIQSTQNESLDGKM